MQTQHTPGPWEIERSAAALSTNQTDYIISHTDDGLRSHVARLFANALCREHGNVLANAKLIAAAPELLEALESVIGWVAIGINEGAYERCALPNAAKIALDKAQAAIAKATT